MTFGVKMRCIFFVIFSLFLGGCGASGGCENTTNQSSEPTFVVDGVDYSTVTVERGPVLFAKVVDANGTEAKNTNFGYSNTYSFSSLPKLPITASGGYIDINLDGKLDANDTKLDINLTSYTNIISPITTMIENNTTKRNYFMNLYDLNETELLQTIPSKNAKTIILNNGIFEAMKRGYLFRSTEFNTTLNDINTTYTQSYSSETNLSQIAIGLENSVMTNLVAIKLDTNEQSIIEAKLAHDFFVEPLYLRDGNFSRSVISSDPLDKRWNITFKLDNISNQSDIDVGIKITKLSSGTIGNIVIENANLTNGVMGIPSKVSIYGANTSGSSSSTSYGSSHNIAKNALAMIGDKLLLNLGYIIKNQTIVSSEKFATASTYKVEVFITKVSVGGVGSETTEIQVTTAQNVTIASGQKITGTLEIGN
jgi:hypothetical protein